MLRFTSAHDMFVLNDRRISATIPEGVFLGGVVLVSQYMYVHIHDSRPCRLLQKGVLKQFPACPRSNARDLAGCHGGRVAGQGLEGIPDGPGRCTACAPGGVPGWVRPARKAYAI